MMPSACRNMPSDNQHPWRFWLAALGAMVFFTLVYKYTLRAWFQYDDFAWLGISLQVHSWRDFWHAMFAPMAGGSIRPFSDRALFLGFYPLFGLHALPYRIAIYVTQLANIAVLGMIAQRLTKSDWAAFAVPVLWSVNSVLAWPLTWTSAYNEVLCSLVFLVAFYALVRYVETDNWRFNALQWTAFLFGFGVLEINVMYPLIAILYVLLIAPKFLKSMLPLLIPSIVFSIIHFAMRVKPQKDVYALHLDLTIFSTLVHYWNIALDAGPAGEYFPRFHFAALPLTALFSAAILGFAAWRAWRGDRIPIFCLGWFVLALAPFLPIFEHTSDYYAMVPAIGLALLGGWALVLSLRNNWFYRLLTLGLMALYLACAIPLSRLASRYIFAHSVPVKKLVLGVREVHQKNPGKIIFLEDLDDELFWDGVYDRPFRLFGAEVYLTPAAAEKIRQHPELNSVAGYTMSESAMLAALSGNRALIYDARSGKLIDVSELSAGLPRRIELARPPLDSLLGPSWYAAEGNFRWMPKDASVRLGVPESGTGEIRTGVIRVDAFCAPVQIAAQPLVVWLSIDGRPGPRLTVRDCNQPVILKMPLDAAPGKKEIEVGVHVDRTIRVGGDQRDLGLGVRSIQVEN